MPCGQRGEVDAHPPHSPSWSGADVLARDERGIPALLRHKWGDVTVVYLSAALEAGGFSEAELARWYANELSLCT